MKYKVNFKALSTKQKIEYVWDYYKWHVVIFVFVISMIVSTVQNAINYKEPLLNIIMLNSYESIMDTEIQGFEDFLKKYNYDSFEGAVEIKKDIFISESDEPSLADYQSYETLFSLLVGQEFQLIMWSGENPLDYLDEGFLVDLSEILPRDLLESNEKCLIYSRNEEKEYPCAITLLNNQWIDENNYYNEECYIGILYQENISKVAIEFIEFVLNYKSQEM